MSSFRAKMAGDEGFTFIETILAIVIMSILTLGLTITLLAFKEQLDRSWAIRVMDQYGNDVVERFTHEMRNAVDINVRHVMTRGEKKIDKVNLTYMDQWNEDLLHTSTWEVDNRWGRMLINRSPAIDPFFPPSSPGRGESYEIVQFTVSPYGTYTPEAQWETGDRRAHRTPEFLAGTWDIHVLLRYNRAAIGGRKHSWKYEKLYFNRSYMRNYNEPFQKKKREEREGN